MSIWTEFYADTNLLPHWSYEWQSPNGRELKTNKQVGLHVFASQFDVDGKCKKSWFLVTKAGFEIPESRKVVTASIETGKVIVYNEKSLDVHYEDDWGQVRKEALNSAYSAQCNRDTIQAKRVKMCKEWESLISSLERATQVNAANQLRIDALEQVIASHKSWWQRLLRRGKQ